MKKSKFLIKMCLLALIFITTLITETHGQILPPNDSAYHLVWYDNFISTNLDTSKWNKTFPWHQSSNYAYLCGDSSTTLAPMAAIKVWRDHWNLDTTNCKINNGTLKLTTKKGNYGGTCWNWISCTPPSNCNFYNYCDQPPNCGHIDTLPFKYTTAMLYSRWDFRYGYFEIKFKLPAAPASPKTLQGHGATFWLWGTDGNIYSEIDGFEINAYNQNTLEYYSGMGNSHYSEDFTVTDPNSDPTPTYIFTGNTWHTVGINWTSNAIDYYYDGTLKYQSHNHPDSLHALAIIITLGGNYVPVDNYCEPFDSTGADSTHFPYTYEIDYVKVWQPKKDCNKDTTLTSFNASTYKNQLYKSITMGSNISIANLNSQSFWGSDYILLNGVTSIDGNSNVLFNVTNCNNVSLTRARSSTFAEPMPDAFKYKLTMHY